MKNIDGALGFEATLDIDDFNVSADAMERHIKDVSTHIQADASDMEQSLLDFAQKGAMYLQTYLVGQGLMSVVNSIVQVRGQFQQLEIAFGTMLGSEEKANELMQQMINTAAHTPFDLQGVAEGAKQLLAYGEASDKVNDTLVRLGNIASGLSIPLNDIVYLYGTTMVQGRLYAQDVRQFTGRGIPLVKELAAMYGVTAEEINAMVSAGKIGFPDVEKVLNKLTDAGGQFYNLMEKQSASLTGMISNLEDAWDSMLNDIGTQNQDMFGEAIQSATYLVEHYQKILDVVKAIAIGYGSVKAAIVLNTLATKGYTGVALIDNTVHQAKLALMRAEATLTGTAKAQTDAMTAARQAHVAALQSELTAEEQINLVKQLRINTITQLLTAQQQEYLSNLNLTTSSAGYEAAALQILTADQQMALQKTDLSTKSAIYVAALEQEVNAKRQGAAASLESMRANVKAAAAKMEATKQTAVSAIQATEAARYEVYWAKQSGDATRLAIAQKKLEGAEENQAIARKTALAASTDFYAKKKALETAATRTSTAASAGDTAAKAAQTAATGVLATVTHGLTAAFKTLWATMAANPFGAILSVVGLVISAFTLFKDEEEETNTVMGEFQETTKQVTDRLNTLLAIVRTTAEGTKTHKDAIAKINELCKEYNTTLIEENDTLDEQEVKYQNLQKAIQATTAEKIKAKYAEQALQKATDDNAESLKQLMDLAKVAQVTLQEAYQVDAGDKILSVPGIYAAADNIRNASDAVWEAVESMASEKAQELSKLTGDAYTKAFDQSLKDIVSTVQTATGASDKEMQDFEKNLSRYLSEVTDHTRTANTELDKIDNQLSAFFGTTPDSSKITSETDLVTLSFEELDTQIKDNKKQIDELNAKIIDPKTKTDQIDELKQKLQEALDLQGKLNGAVTTKTDNLNTENGISARIKQLKDERANVEINSQSYKDLTKQITALQGKLPKTTAGGGSDDAAANAADALAQKQIESQRKLEEARIEVMRDGYAKRKALLDLEHRRNLDQIDKEEKELIKARKKAGKSGISQEEKDGFTERRNLENQSYTVDSTKLFDTEIDYRKKQYDAYWQWVNNVGKDVADTHFRDLISEGTSFTAWVNQQVAALEQKRANEPGSFNDGDANALNSLKLQQDAITGNKSAMELFRDSVQKAVGQAQTLAEKLQAVADLKDKLGKGGFHLNEDETAAASYQLEQQDSQLQEEVNNTLLTQYKTYEEQKLSIQKQYQLLRSAAEQEGNAQRLEEIARGEQEALSALNAQMLMQSDSWRNLFSDLDSLTTSEIDKLITEIQDKMNTADLNLNPTDLKTVLDKLDEAKKKILDVNPFKALGKSIQNVFKKQQDGSKKTSKQIKTDWKNLGESTQACFDFVSDAIDSCSVLGDLIGDTGKATISTLSGIAQAGIAMSAAIKTAEKGSVILAAISIALQAIQWIAGLFNNDEEIEEHIKGLQREVDGLSNALDRLKDAYSHTYWVYSDEEEEAYQKRVQNIKDHLAVLQEEQRMALMMWDFRKYSEITKQIKELQYTLEKATATGDMFDLVEAQKENLKKQQELIKEQIEAEKSKKDTDTDKILQWEEAIKDIDTQIQDLERDMMETLAGTDVKSAIDEFADALVEAYCQGEDAAEALGKKTKDVLKNAVVEALKRRYLALAINDAVEYLSQAMGDSVLTDEERAHFTSMVDQAGNAFNQALEAVGDWIKDVEEDENADPLSGAIQNLSEETGDIIAGRLNAAIINQSEQTTVLRLMAGYLQSIVESGGISVQGGSVTDSLGDLSRIYEIQVDQTAIMRQQLEYQAQIAANTGSSSGTLLEIQATLKRMETNGNSLLSQGIS